MPGMFASLQQQYFEDQYGTNAGAAEMRRIRNSIATQAERKHKETTMTMTMMFMLSSAAANNTKHEHLGDGVYASFDGHQVWLDLRGQGNNTAIALEPQVMEELIAYARRVGVGREWH